MHGNETTVLEHNIMTLVQLYVTHETRKSVESHQILFRAGACEGLGPRLGEHLSVIECTMFAIRIKVDFTKSSQSRLRGETH